MQGVRCLVVGLVVSTLMVNCAAPPVTGTTDGTGPAAIAGPKRINAAIKSAPLEPSTWMNPAAVSQAGQAELERLVSVGATTPDGEGGLMPVLAEATPTVENGLWKLFPDGRMETTWVLRTGATWHDGRAVTAEDFVFSAQVRQDRDLPIARNLIYDFVDQIDAPDARTIRATWKRPYIAADTLVDGAPLPRHLLEAAYLESKATFAQLPYWSTEFVSTGPFKIREWVPGSHALLLAHEQYVLGRPQVDELEVRFIVDSTTLAANMLAGAVELTIGRNLSVDQAVQIRDQWTAGKAVIGYKNWLTIYPQFINPNPAVIGDLTFRRALMHAMDRQQMVDNLMAGLTTVAHTTMNPGQADYRDVEARAMRYDFDARRATQMIEGLGFSRAADGSWRDRAGQPLAVEIRTSAGDDLQEKTLFAAADFWRRMGIGVDTVLVPAQRANDREYRNTFPGFDVKRQPNDVDSFQRMHGAFTPLPENNYVGSNFSRYVNPALDAMIDRYLATIPKQERVRVAGELALYIAEHLTQLGLYFQAEPTMIAHQLQSVRIQTVGGTIHTGNAHEWDRK